MNLFDQIVTEALKHQPDLSSLRIVVEKELLHHDILRILSENKLLQALTFIGGTCLRACYGGVRLSEDLDFTGGLGFDRHSLSAMSCVLTDSLYEKYGLRVVVSEPVKDIKNVSTWKIKIETRPEQKHLPAQRINIDICKVPSYERRPMLLLNPYGVEMGTQGLVIQAQSREEIYVDKIIAFALRPNRIKHRDLWDMVWLHQQGIKPSLELLANKLEVRQITQALFLQQLDQRCQSLNENNNLAIEFKKEMQRFLPFDQLEKITQQEHFWPFIVQLMSDLQKLCRHALGS